MRTHCTRQQEIVIKSESNTKSCVDRITTGTTDRKNLSSIGPSRTGEKYFSVGGTVGFYASGHDRKMTKKWDFRAGKRKSPAQEERGQSGENSFGSAPGVADSRIDLKMLRERHQGGKQKRTSPTPVNSAYPARTAMKKGGPRRARLLSRHCRLNIQQWRRRILGDSNQR